MKKINEKGKIDLELTKEEFLVINEKNKLIQWNEIKKIFDIPRTTLNRVAESGEIKRYKYINNVYYLYDDLEKYMNKRLKIKEEYRTVNALRKELKLRDEYIKSVISSSNIKSIIIDKLEFYNKKEFLEASNNYKEKKKSDKNKKNSINESNENNNFITQASLINIFNLSRFKIVKVFNELGIKSIKEDNKVLYFKNEIEQLLDRIALEFGFISEEIIFENLYGIDDLNEKLKLKNLDFINFCGKNLYILSQINNVIKKLINKRFIYGKIAYIKQPYIDRIHSNFEDFKLDDSNIYNVNEVIKVLNNFSNNFIYYFENNDLYLGEAEIFSISGIGKEEVLNFINKDTDILFIKRFEPEEIRLMRNMFKTLLIRSGYLSLMEMNILINTKKNPVMRVKKEDIKYFILFDKTKYVKIELYIEQYKNYIKKASRGFENIKYSIEVRLSLVKNQYIVTNKLANQFLTKVYNDDNSKDKSTYNRCINSIEWLLNNYWDKEIFEYTDKFIEEDILIKCTNSHGIRICQFFNYMKNSKLINCNYNKIYGNSVIEQLKESEKEVNNKIYSEKEWIKFYDFLKNIEFHKYKAIKSYEYSQAWLYCLSQLIVFWRRKNVLESIPNIPIELLKVDLEWLKNNDIDDMTAQVILNCIKFGIDGIVAYKNQMQLHFDTPMSLKKPIATALIIVNLHKNINKEEYIFTNLFKKNMNKYIKILLNETDLPMFYNSKAVRSSLTYSFSNAISNEEYKSIAYYLTQYSRSHKIDEEPTDITEQYLYLENTDGEISKISHELMERGIFGYLPYRLIIASMGCEVKKLEQTYITKLINTINEELLPDEIERAAEILVNDDNSIGFINSSLMVKNLLSNKNHELHSKLSREILMSVAEYVNESNEVIEEMRKKGETETLSILMEILKNKRNCKDNLSNCILNDIERINKCPHKNSDNGIGCKYNIRSLMSLYEVNSRMLDIINRLNDNLSDIERIKYSKILKSYLIIINEAYIQYKFLDEYFLNAYFNKTDIVDKIKKLNKSNKIISCVEQNTLIKSLKESRGRI